MSKACICCRKSKPLADFYRHSRMADGHLNKCKPCVRSSVALHRSENIERIRAYDRMRAARPSSIKGRALTTAAWRSRGPAARAAHSAVAHALRNGKLRRGKCEDCGSLRVHAHHDDYLKPLSVRWLCAEHHKQWHASNGPGANAAAQAPSKRKVA